MDHEVGDSPVLEIRKALAACYGLKKVGKQYVEEDKL